MVESAEHAKWYFDDQCRSNAEYWSRFGRRPDWSGRRVLDLGCGHGAMSVEIAEAGATVFGIDLDEDRIAFAQANATARFPHLADRLSFAAVDAADVPADESFDVIVSKDTFEHVQDIPALLNVLPGLLTPGGRLYAGFSQLYYSPFGDHGRTGLRVPWAHALLPKRLVLARAARFQHADIATLADLGLNGWTGRQFLQAFDASPLQVCDVAINRGTKPLLSLLSRLRRYRVLDKYVTVSIYAVLTAPAV